MFGVNVPNEKMVKAAALEWYEHACRERKEAF